MKYTQVKVTVDSAIATAFKTACIASGKSMTSVLVQFMNQYIKANESTEYSPDLSTRRQRRVAVQSVMRQLERIKENEERYQENIPDNLQGSEVYERAEESISVIAEAIEILEGAY